MELIYDKSGLHLNARERCKQDFVYTPSQYLYTNVLARSGRYISESLSGM